MMTLYHKIIVPLDGSELSDQALRPAMLMAETTGATVNLVRCFGPIPGWQVDSYEGRHSGSMAASEHVRITAWLTAHRLRLANDGSTVPMEVSAHEGPAVEHITRLANQDPDAPDRHVHPRARRPVPPHDGQCNQSGGQGSSQPDAHRPEYRSSRAPYPGSH